LIYVLVSVALFLTSAGFYYGLDRYLHPKLGFFRFLATGAFDPGNRPGVAKKMRQAELKADKQEPFEQTGTPVVQAS